MRMIAVMLRDLTQEQIDTLDDMWPIEQVGEEDLLGIYDGRDFDYWHSDSEPWEYVTYEQLLSELLDLEEELQNGR
jgi:hypothetical protein